MTNGYLALLALAAGGSVVWALDVVMRPWKRCRACKGSGRVRVRGNRFDDCRRCEGGRRSKRLRAGAGWLRPDLKGRQK